MRTVQRVIVTCGLLGVVCVLLAAAPDGTSARKVKGPEQSTYVLVGDSLFSRGCMGGGWHGCMCPQIMATKYTGTFSLTPDWHTPPGASAFDVTVEDWVVLFDDEDIEITGYGRYNKWTETDGSSWHLMTLDLYIYDEVVYFDSGVQEDPHPGGGFPEEINIALQTDQEACFGYVTYLEAVHPSLAATKLDVEQDASAVGESLLP